MFDWRGHHGRELEALRNGLILVPEIYGNSIHFRSGIDWGVFDANITAAWWLNTLMFARPLLLSRDEHDLSTAILLLKDWLAANPLDNPKSSRAWDGQGAGTRAELVACIRTRIVADWLDEAGEQHAEFLVSPKNYQGNWNHGLDQNIGLLCLGYAFANPEWISLARDRSITAIARMVDWQSISVEQAVKYHFYNYLRFEDCAKLFEECGAPLPQEILERTEPMPEFLAHATKPDGSWIPLGESTDYRRGRDRLAGTEADFALSKGTSGIRPRSRFAVYQAGYVFGRSGWGDKRRFEDETYYTLRFGPGRIIHGHDDHTSLTYFSRGQDIIVDGGFSGYADPRWRDHLRSPAAHNVVHLPGNENFRRNEVTKLTEFRIERSWQSYRLDDKPYDQTARSRSVLLVQTPIEAVIVLDSISGAIGLCEQVWHIDPQFEISIEAGITTGVSEPVVFTAHQLWPYDSIEVVSGQKEPAQGWAGFGDTDVRPVPTILTRQNARSPSFMIRKVRSATFLTVFVIHAPGEAAPDVVLGKVQKGQPSRRLWLRTTQDEVTALISQDNLLRVTSQETYS